MAARYILRAEPPSAASRPTAVAAAHWTSSLRLPGSTLEWTLALFLLWFGSHAFFYYYQHNGLNPLYSYFALFAVAGLLLLARLAAHRPVLPLADRRIGRLARWSLIYFGYTALTLALLAQGNPDGSPLLRLIAFLGIAWSFVLLLVDGGRMRLAMTVFVVAAIFGAVVNMYDFVVPTFSETPGRGAGLYGDPNIAGTWISMAMVAGFAVVPQRLRMAFVGLCGLGVLATFSREAWLLWGIGFVGLYAQGHLGRRRNAVVNVLAGGLIGGGLLVMLFTGAIGDIVESSHLKNYLNSNTLSRLGISSSVFSGESAEGRQALIYRSLEEAAAAPVFGHGFGYTFEWPKRPHNMYLLFLVEGGLLGLAIYCGLMILLFRAGVGLSRIVAMQFALGSVFTHNNFEQASMIIMIAFIVAHGALMSHARRRALQSGRLPSPLAPARRRQSRVPSPIPLPAA